MQHPWWTTALGTGCLLLFAAPAAHAWSIESAASAGCHEQITFTALEASGWPEGATPPEMSDEDRRIANDAPFTLPDAHRNIWDITVVLANREIDLGGHEPDELPELSQWHARGDKQALHCLRSPSEDGAEGDGQALADCHAFIMNELELAVGAGDTPDLAARETNQVFLTFRETADLSLPRYAYHLGRALHALQDGFSHAFRDPTNLSQVRSVLNYTEWTGNHSFDPARDGYQHLAYLDACRDVDELQQRRFDAAVTASADLMNALADGTGGRAGRLARADAVMLQYLSLDPDQGETMCVAANNWCGAPEIELATHWTGGSGCTVSTGAAGGAGMGGALALALVALALPRRRRKTLVMALVVGTIGAPLARAQEKPKDKAAEQAEKQHERIDAQAAAKGAPPGKPIARGIGIYVMARGALQEAGVALAVGVRYDLVPRFTIGLDAELNPWVNLTAGGDSASPGTFNLYGTGIFLWDVERRIELRSTIHAGMSYMLDDLAAAARGSIGPFFGIAPVGVAFRAGKHLRVVVDPGVMVAIPSTKGTPLIRQQYGLAVGVQWYP